MSLYYIASEENMNHLVHHGVKGQKWGIRKNNHFYTIKKHPKLSEDEKAKKKKIARNVAIGVGTAAAIGGAAYIGSRFVKNRKAIKSATSELNEAKKYSKVLKDRLDKTGDINQRFSKPAVWESIRVQRGNNTRKMLSIQQQIDYLKKHPLKF